MLFQVLLPVIPESPAEITRFLLLPTGLLKNTILYFMKLTKKILAPDRLFKYSLAFFKETLVYLKFIYLIEVYKSFFIYKFIFEEFLVFNINYYLFFTLKPKIIVETLIINENSIYELIIIRMKVSTILYY